MGGSVNWADPSSMQALRPQHTASHSTAQHDGTYMTGHIHTPTLRSCVIDATAVSALTETINMFLHIECQFTCHCPATLAYLANSLPVDGCKYRALTLNPGTVMASRLHRPKKKGSSCNAVSIEHPFSPRENL